MAASLLGADRAARTALRPPSLVGFAQSNFEAASVLWKAVKSPDPNGYDEQAQKSGVHERHRGGQKGGLLPYSRCASLPHWDWNIRMRSLVPKAGLEPARL